MRTAGHTPYVRPLRFVDTETIALRADHRYPWEVAVLGEGYVSTVVRIDWGAHIMDSYADEDSLAIGGYHERFRADEAVTPAEAVSLIWPMLRDATLVAANPTFDVLALQRLARLVNVSRSVTRRQLYDLEPWHHRVIDVEALTYGHIGHDVGGLVNCARALGVHVDESRAHSALYDAGIARDIFETINIGRKAL